MKANELVPCRRLAFPPFGVLAAAFLWGTLLLNPSRLFAESIELRDQRRDGEVVQVKVTLDAHGELTSMEGDKLQDDKPMQTEMAVKAQAVFAERLLSHSGEPGCRSVRKYETAKADLRVGTEHEVAELSDSSRRVVNELVGSRVRVWSLGGQLTRREIDLVQPTTQSLVVDQLLPGKPVQPGDRWTPNSESLAAVLQMDHIGINETVSQLIDIQRGIARLEIKGLVKGRVDGVLTEIEVTGDYRYDVRWNRVTWLQLNLHEKREQSATSPSFDIVSEVRMLIEPLAPEKIAGLDLPAQVAVATPNDLLVRMVSNDAGIELSHTRDWLHVEERQRQVTLRWADEEKARAQCSIVRLKDTDAKTRVKLGEFQADIQKALGTQFGGFERAKEIDRGDGYKVLRVAVRGAVSEVPIRWVYYHVTSPEGYQVSLTFTAGADEERVAELAEHERQFVASLHLGPALDSKTTLPAAAVPPKEQASRPTGLLPKR